MLWRYWKLCFTWGNKLVVNKLCTNCFAQITYMHYANSPSQQAILLQLWPNDTLVLMHGWGSISLWCSDSASLGWGLFLPHLFSFPLLVVLRSCIKFFCVGFSFDLYTWDAQNSAWLLVQVCNSSPSSCTRAGCSGHAKQSCNPKNLGESSDVETMKHWTETIISHIHLQSLLEVGWTEYVWKY